MGATLYSHFFQAVRDRGCTLVHAVTDPCNTSSVAFHVALGFVPRRVPAEVREGSREADGATHERFDTGVGGDGEEEGVMGQSVLRASPDGGVQVCRGFVHVDFDGPDDGDRVVMEKCL